MDQELKQRLVGAVVITALAAIFIPMLFDDPVDETGKKINELKIPELPERLQSSQAVRVPQNSDDVIELPLKRPMKTVTAASDQASALHRWYLQVGLFSQQENALSLRDQLRRQGYAASVSKVKGDQGEMYKVKVGPEMNRDRAEAIKVKLKQQNDLNSFVIQDED
ncbi:SPOR domain-containing protein [Methylomarinum sp. Ch1-1]|uniref:SPOR domain-containing protein n=1 Tax=Methylomarinum roseum TaxID=3067653 RepID=A0AAU7NPY0_9GAMM|nr:SPOR domain-containing protein [Methylomarinum sp. Ch1-1]MDP4521044.1 SPOR domain-containing protein [Methylomarinum sp. Ch1-1]